MSVTGTGIAGRAVLITGAGRGLGLAYARRLAGAGAHVALADRDGASATGSAMQLRDEGASAVAFTADVTEPDQVRGLVAAVAEAIGPVEVLINNAGRSVPTWGPMEDFTLEDWTQTLAVNLTGTWLCTQAVVPAMKRAGAGKIINISTTIVSQGVPTGAAPYVAAKAGVVGLTRTLAKELGPFGITVNAVAPGLVPMDKAAVAPERAVVIGAMIESVVAQQALARVEVPDDLSGVVEFLASDAADFMTGQVLNVDGGWALT